MPRQRPKKDADDQPWTLEQFQQFAADLERTPANHRELWELTVSRLEDLKHFLEEGDESISPVLLNAAKEQDLRSFTAFWFREKAHGRYDIAQEDELADGKRPDIRIKTADFDAPVPIELKLAERWTGPNLFERLENQLCGDYLRDVRSGRGVFLLYQQKEGSWSPPQGKKTRSLEELVDALQAHWALISERYPNVEDVRVIGIDLRRRTAKKDT